MTRKDLPFQPWGLAAIKNGDKTLTSRCSGLAAVNKNPDEWEYGGENVHGQHIFYNKDDDKDGLLLRCPWQVGVDYNGVAVMGITAKRVQDMNGDEAEAEGVPVIGCALPIGGDIRIDAFARIWDSIHRRDVNNRYNRNPWTFRLSVRKT